MTRSETIPYSGVFQSHAISKTVDSTEIGPHFEEVRAYLFIKAGCDCDSLRQVRRVNILNARML
ncbi:hypothetical protein KL86DES1_20443 [uncultured Desulfovibrio sp.]|uniref:Uncharacterized protein n=1 Tax=uncultured Desulfovibrio sp. TaxID=167968 RepID=A0A212L3U0_9BACT|nr:hypothetical protein KL86DES1_20443 [uncultured Desulfovibrio sp.]VZH33346.1 conserved protein of unknown function [Desulfovibrio sp. 86]